MLSWSARRPLALQAGQGIRLGHGLSAGISVGRLWDPRTGGGFEIVAVRPDVEVPAADALEVALRRARGPVPD